MFKKENLLTTSFIIVIVLLVGFAIFGSFFKKEEALPTLKTTTDMAFNMEEQPVLGKSDAPVTLSLFYDYNCPHCQQWEETIFPIVQSTVLNDENVNLRFINYQFMRPTSIYAGMAAEMVYDLAPEKFLDFNSMLFDNQLAINLDYLAEKVNEFVPSVTVEQAKDDILNQKYMDHVLSDKKHAEKVGVTGTPSLFVNDIKVENPGDLAEIQAKVKAELEKASEKK